MKKGIGSLVLASLVSSSAAFADSAWLSCREAGGVLSASVSPTKMEIGSFFDKPAFFEQTIEIGEHSSHKKAKGTLHIHGFKPTFELWFHGRPWSHGPSETEVQSDGAKVTLIEDCDVKKIIREQVTRVTDVETFVRQDRGFHVVMKHGIFDIVHHRAFVPAGVDTAYIHFHSMFTKLHSVGAFHHSHGSTSFGSALEFDNGYDCLVSVIRERGCKAPALDQSPIYVLPAKQGPEQVTPDFTPAPGYSPYNPGPGCTPVNQGPGYVPVTQEPAYVPVIQEPAYVPVNQGPAYTPVTQNPGYGQIDQEPGYAVIDQDQWQDKRKN